MSYLGALGIIAVAFSDRITLGSVLVMLVVGSIAIANTIAGGKRWKDEFEAKKVECDRQRERANNAEALQLKAELRVQQLEERPDLAQIVQTMGELAVKEDAVSARRTEEGVKSVERTVREEFRRHEERAQERHEASIDALQEITNAIKERAA